MPPFRQILIANRGEIAVRAIRACQELGIAAVAIYSEADAGSLHTTLADAAVCIGPPPPLESYLRGDLILQAALDLGCDAIHPGYGFLAENAGFADAVRQAGVVFIGPSADAMRAMGSKIASREIMHQAGVPVTPGYHPASVEPGEQAAELLAAAEALAYPLLVKASAGGGGKGMRTVARPDEMEAAIASAQREAANAFADPTVYLEKLIAGARHVEFQILADHSGHTLHLGERECSIQRRHQKIIEETPSPALAPDLRARMGAAAVAAAQAVGYVNAGTVEFLLDPDGEFYFLEMNTRLQVEHPITELVTGIDLVKAQIRIAAGEALGIQQEQVWQRGHAIEARIYAEDAAHDFLPSTGRVLLAVQPQGPGIRVDAGIVTGDEVSIYYDPMIAKLVVVGEDRTDAVRKLRWALGQYVIMGVATNIPFLQAVAAHPAFASGDLSTDFVQRHMADWAPSHPPIPAEALIAAALADHLHARAGVAAPAAGDADIYSPWNHADAFRSGNPG